MSKTLIAVVLAVGLAAGGYVWYQQDQARKAEEAAAAAEAAAQAEAEAAAQAAAEAAAKAEAEAAAQAAAEAAAKAEAEAAAQAEAEAAAQAEAEAAAQTQADAANANADAAADTAPQFDAALLTPEGFDAGKLGELVQNSSLGTVQKATLQAAIAQAAQNPDLVAGVLEQITNALGL